MLDAGLSELPPRPTPELTDAIRIAAAAGDIAGLMRLTQVDDAKAAWWAALAHVRLMDAGTPLFARMTSRQWLMQRNLSHLVPEHPPRALGHAGFRLDRHGGVVRRDLFDAQTVAEGDATK